MFLFLNRSFTASSIHSPQTHVPSPPSLSLSPSLFLSIHPGRRCGSRGLRPTRQQPASAINFRAPTPSNISLPFVYAPVPLFAGGPRYTRINALRITVKRREKNPPPPPPRSISICEMALATGPPPSSLPSFPCREEPPRISPLPFPISPLPPPSIDKIWRIVTRRCDSKKVSRKELDAILHFSIFLILVLPR